MQIKDVIDQLAGLNQSMLVSVEINAVDFYGEELWPVKLKEPTLTPEQIAAAAEREAKTKAQIAESNAFLAKNPDPSVDDIFNALPSEPTHPEVQAIIDGKRDMTVRTLISFLLGCPHDALIRAVHHPSYYIFTLGDILIESDAVYIDVGTHADLRFAEDNRRKIKGIAFRED